MENLIKNVVKTTVEDIERVRSFQLSKDQLKMYWLTYPREVPKEIRAQISGQIFSQTKARVLWISGTEVQVVLH